MSKSRRPWCFQENMAHEVHRSVPSGQLVAAAILVVLTVGCRKLPSAEQGPTGAATIPSRIVSPDQVNITPLPPGEYISTLIEGVPHVRQRPDFCGEAAVEMATRKLGTPVTQDQVFQVSGMDPARGMGATTTELTTALRRLGFDVGTVRYSVPAREAPRGLERLFAGLHQDLMAGIPSIVCMHYSSDPDTTEHFRLVLGYDRSRDELIYHEPAEDEGAYRRMPRAEFLRLWPLPYDPEHWTVIRWRLKTQGVTIPPPHGGRFAPAEYAQHVLRTKRKLGSAADAFTFVVEPPFVVIGDGAPEQTKASAAGTVRWTVERLKQDYFTKDPERILDIWLFQDSESYAANTRAIFDIQPTTPYGFYSDRNGALIMNIATGGGTLVHEIVHPFIEANFPGCPAWFNEGLGSLYEQSAERKGHIVGLTNWRLAALQQAVRSDQVPSIQWLTARTEVEFYDEDPGTNYAQARYLLYYLQERGLLVKYYHAFHEAQRNDPTGYATLVGLLGNPDMNDFERSWKQFVLSLRFEP